MEMLKEVRNQPKIDRKRIKVQEITVKGEEDRISTLTDLLLIEILCRLPCTKAAIRTGTLSKRWKHLWTQVHTLIFAHQEEDFTSSLQRQNPKWRPGFFSFVEKTLIQCRQSKLKKFEVYTGYDIQYESQVNNWIHFSISRDVEEVNLILFYLIDQIVFTSSCFTDLRLDSYTFKPTGAISWKNLRNLCISFAELDEDMIQNILSGRPQLEKLELVDCFGYTRLDITSKSVKNLVFSGYMDFNPFKTIEINAPNILSLTIDHLLLPRSPKLLLLNVSSLVEANIDYTKFWPFDRKYSEAEDEMLKGLILNLRHVKELKIWPYYYKVVSRLEAKGFDFPSNFKLAGVFNKFFESESESESENDSENDSDVGNGVQDH